LFHLWSQLGEPVPVPTGWRVVPVPMRVVHVVVRVEVGWTPVAVPVAVAVAVPVVVPL